VGEVAPEPVVVRVPALEAVLVAVPAALAAVLGALQAHPAALAVTLTRIVSVEAQTTTQACRVRIQRSATRLQRRPNVTVAA
jgi:hypothetical protein